MANGKKTQRMKVVTFFCIVLGLVFIATNCFMIISKSLSTLFIESVHSVFDVPRLRNEIMASTLKVVAGPSFLKSTPESQRYKIMAELGQMFPGFVLLTEQDYSKLDKEFRTNGVLVDTLEIIGDTWTTGGIPNVRVGEKFYSTSGYGSRNVAEWSYWGLIAIGGTFRHINMRGGSRKGIKSLDPYRFLPSNPYYVPVGQR